MSTGVVHIDVDAAGPEAPYDAWCEQQLAGGGWALALKVRADAEGPLGSAPVWTARALVNGASLDPEQDENARLAPYFEQPLGAVLVVMEVETGIFPAAVLLKVRGQSLHDLIASGNGYPSTLLRENWFALVGSSDLQPNCGRQGLNVRGSEDLLRIGILGNNENDCTSTDSWLGIGGTDRCGDPGNDVGNGAGLVGPDTCVRARTWVYVRDEDFTFHPPATDCVSHLAQGRFDDGIYLVGSGDRVRCDMTNHGGGWTSVLDFDAASDACPASFVPAFGAEPEVAACGAPPGVTSSSLTLPAPFAYREVMTRTLGYQRGKPRRSLDVRATSPLTIHTSTVRPSRQGRLGAM